MRPTYMDELLAVLSFGAISRSETRGSNNNSNSIPTRVRNSHVAHASRAPISCEDMRRRAANNTGGTRFTRECEGDEATQRYVSESRDESSGGRREVARARDERRDWPIDG